jgi:hypothetical protein
MNDFTKDELLDLYISCGFSIDEDLYKETYQKKYFQLKNKLKSMIDNYCEHIDTHVDYDMNVQRCKKCLKAIDECE